MQVNYPSRGVFQGFYEQQKKFETPPCKKSPKKEKVNRPVLAAALAGAVLPVVALNVAKGRGGALVQAFKNKGFKEKGKALLDIFEIEGFKEILASNAGGIAGGLITGILTAKNKSDKKEKAKEGAFEFMNCMIPTFFAAAGELLANKTGKLTSKPAQALRIAASVAGGMFVANKASNALNEKVFDKNETTKTKRHFKPTDCLVHIDDMIDLLIIAKVPLAKKIHADKVLPFLYARSGHEAGAKEKDDAE